MTIKTYLKYRWYLLTREEPRNIKEDFKKPQTWAQLWTIMFLSSIALWFILGSINYLILGILSSIPMFLLMVYLDYRNTPWLKWYTEKLKEESKHDKKVSV